MHSEMSDLKTLATDGVSKLRMREKLLLEEQRRDRETIADMEKQLNSLRSSSRQNYSDTQGTEMFHSSYANSPSLSRLKTPEEYRGTSSRADGFPFNTPSTTTFSERKLQYELSTEKELRYKAEEICAGVLANSKAALEERDSEINKLRAQLFQLSNKRYSGGR